LLGRLLTFYAFLESLQIDHVRQDRPPSCNRLATDDASRPARILRKALTRLGRHQEHFLIAVG
jgi:hypothetical protein